MTPSGRSKSFANPNIMQAANRYLVSYFMPTEGNYEHEAGDLIYVIDSPIPTERDNEEVESMFLV